MVLSKIVYIIGRSSSGKDTIFKELMRDKSFKFNQIVSYTTRPIRSAETEGVEYHFVDEEGFNKLKESGKIIEDRCYNTIHGPWRYFTVDDGQFDMDGDFMAVGTIESYVKIRNYFGRNRVIPVYVDLDDGLRLQRALNRERRQEHPKYEEMCRRFLADAKDFSEEKVKEAELTRRFINDDLKTCLQEIKDYIRKEL